MSNEEGETKPLFREDEQTTVMARPASPRRRTQWWTVSLVVSAAALAVAFIGGRMVADLPLSHRLFAVRAVGVSGLARTPRDDAIRAAGLLDARSLLALNLEHGVAAVESLPWVRRATLRRQLPDRVQLDVVEHVAALSAMLGELWLVNTDGQPFKHFTADDQLVLPMVTGLSAQPQVEVPYAEQGALVARLGQALCLHDALVAARDDLYNVEQLHHDEDLGWSVTVLLGRAQGQTPGERAGVTVHLGTDPLARLGHVVDALSALADRKLTPRTVWAANLHQAGRVQVALQGGPFVASAPAASLSRSVRARPSPRRPAPPRRRSPAPR